jgi:hypothetical protein
MIPGPLVSQEAGGYSQVVKEQGNTIRLGGALH